MKYMMDGLALRWKCDGSRHIGKVECQKQQACVCVWIVGWWCSSSSRFVQELDRAWNFVWVDRYAVLGELVFVGRG